MIIGFSGKKQSGKSSCAKWIIATFLKYCNLVNGAGVKDNGDLFVEYISDSGESFSEIIDIDKTHPLLSEIAGFVSKFSFSDELKGSLLRVFRVKPECLFGTNHEKNQPTHILWNDIKKLLPKKAAAEYEKSGIIVNGFVTGRGLMQVWGTDICRIIQDSCWIDSAISNAKDFGSLISIIPDVRFPNEVEAIQKSGGKVIRLLRTIDDPDSHASETELDDYPLDKFDKVIDNKDFTMSDLCKNLYFTLKEFDVLPFEIKG